MVPKMPTFYVYVHVRASNSVPSCGGGEGFSTRDHYLMWFSNRNMSSISHYSSICNGHWISHASDIRI